MDSIIQKLEQLSKQNSLDYVLSKTKVRGGYTISFYKLTTVNNKVIKKMEEIVKIVSGFSENNFEEAFEDLMKEYSNVTF